MPRFEPDFTKVRASIRIYERGDYLCRIGKARPFAYYKKDDVNPRRQVMVAGMKYPLTMVGKLDEEGQPTDEFRGEPITPMNLYLHSEAAYGMTKRFVMTAAGYDRDHENDFDEEWLPENDLSFEVDDDVDEGEEFEVTVGDGWHTIEGNLIVLTLDKRMYKKTPDSPEQEQQDFKNMIPADSALRSQYATVGAPAETEDEEQAEEPALAAAGGGRGRRGR